MTTSNYFHKDQNVSPGKEYFYRLKQQDFDGRFEYSPVVSAELEARDFIGDFYPNPASQYAKLDINTEDADNLELEIIDVTGKRITSLTYALNEKNTITLPVDYLTAGMYTVRLKVDNRIYVRHFIKND